MAGNLFTPRTWQFWSDPQVRPKRAFEGMLFFGDVMFGGDGLEAFPPFMVKSFSRPGYNRIETQVAEYQLRSGDFAKIDYPTQAFTTSALRVQLADVNVGGTGGADTAGHIANALGMMQKTWNFEEAAISQLEGSENQVYNLFIEGYIGGNPQIITIIELDGMGGSLGEWNMYKPILTAADFSGINYSNNELATIDLRFEYKNFNYESPWSRRDLDRRLKAASTERARLFSSWIDSGTKWLAGANDWYDTSAYDFNMPTTSMVQNR